MTIPQPPEEGSESNAELYLQQIRNNLRTIRGIVIFWNVLICIGLFFAVVSFFVNASSL